MVLVFALLIAFCIPWYGPLAAMEWPLSNAALIRNFGFNDRGRPVLGLVLEGEGELIAADEGEIIFTRHQRDTASRLPSPLGAWLALDHRNGLVSIYGRYRDDRETVQQSSAAGSMPIATAGHSGWSQRDGVYFMLYDRRERRWVNASMIFNPLPDTVLPLIVSIQLRSADNTIINSNQFLNLSQGRYTIVINAVDMLVPGGLRLAPHRITVSVNGEEAGTLTFETISARDGLLMVNRNGLVGARQAYAPYPAFETGEVQLNRGQALLEVVVQDIAGNVRTALTRMIVE